MAATEDSPMSDISLSQLDIAVLRRIVKINIAASRAITHLNKVSEFLEIGGYDERFYPESRSCQAVIRECIGITNAHKAFSTVGMRITFMLYLVEMIDRHEHAVQLFKSLSAQIMDRRRRYVEYFGGKELVESCLEAMRLMEEVIPDRESLQNTLSTA